MCPDVLQYSTMVWQLRYQKVLRALFEATQGYRGRGLARVTYQQGGPRGTQLHFIGISELEHTVARNGNAFALPYQTHGSIYIPHCVDALKRNCASRLPCLCPTVKRNCVST